MGEHVAWESTSNPVQAVIIEFIVSVTTGSLRGGRSHRVNTGKR